MGDIIKRPSAQPVTTRKLEREQGVALRNATLGAQLAEEVNSSIARLTGHATLEFMRVQMLKREAERLAPDGAEVYAMLATAGGIEMANVITRYGRAFG